MDEKEQIIREEFRRVAREYIEAAEEKFIIKLKQDPQRSAEPWNAYPFAFHLERMGQEHEELQNAKSIEHKKDECLDVGIFAIFGWKSLEE